VSDTAMATQGGPAKEGKGSEKELAPELHRTANEILYRLQKTRTPESESALHLQFGNNARHPDLLNYLRKHNHIRFTPRDQTYEYVTPYSYISCKEDLKALIEDTQQDGLMVTKEALEAHPGGKMAEWIRELACPGFDPADPETDPEKKRKLPPEIRLMRRKKFPKCYPGFRPNKKKPRLEYLEDEVNPKPIEINYSDRCPLCDSKTCTASLEECLLFPVNTGRGLTTGAENEPTALQDSLQRLFQKVTDANLEEMKKSLKVNSLPVFTHQKTLGRKPKPKTRVAQRSEISIDASSHSLTETETQRGTGGAEKRG